MQDRHVQRWRTNRSIVFAMRCNKSAHVSAQGIEAATVVYLALLSQHLLQRCSDCLPNRVSLSAYAGRQKHLGARMRIIFAALFYSATDTIPMGCQRWRANLARSHVCVRMNVSPLFSPRRTLSVGVRRPLRLRGPLARSWRQGRGRPRGCNYLVSRARPPVGSLACIPRVF